MKSYDADTAGENYSIQSLGGDIIVTVILHQTDNATEIIKFIVNHINEIDLLVHNVTIGKCSITFQTFLCFLIDSNCFTGVRIVQVHKPQNLHDILENEIDYLEHCVDNPFGELRSSNLSFCTLEIASLLSVA